MEEENKKPSIEVDGKKIEIEPGQTIMQACEKAGIAEGIPRFCYHPGLPIAGTCRMCTVEIEKSPKLMTSCSTPAGDGMVIYTQSEKVRKSREGVMEFLLANHPLDCPVCDQSGECDLQDYDYEYGPHSTRFQESKRKWGESTTKTLSQDITLNMNRCIHCERCVRFTEDVTQTHELLMGERGWQKELTTAGNKGMHNDYQGCLTDICPVGALTFNDFRFEKRVWFLKKAPSVCDRCSKGCNIFMDSEHELIYRYRPRHNAEVNGYWMCDEGRKSYHDFMNPQRVVFPMARSQSEDRGMHSTTWDTVLDEWYQQIKRSNRTLVLIGTDATIEEAEEIQQELASLVEGELEFRSINGTNEVKSSEDDEALDHLLRRKDKTPNTKGLESLGINPCEDEFEKKFDLAIVYRCGRALAPPKKMAKTQVAWGLWTKEEIDEYELVVPGLSTAEKEGTFINCDGIVQRFEPAIKPCGKSKGVSGALLLLSQRVDEKARLAHGVL